MFMQIRPKMRLTTKLAVNLSRLKPKLLTPTPSAMTYIAKYTACSMQRAVASLEIPF